MSFREAGEEMSAKIYFVKAETEQQKIAWDFQRMLTKGCGVNKLPEFGEAIFYQARREKGA